MAQLVVRNLEESVKSVLKNRAKVHGRSLESEVREILREAAATAPSKFEAPQTSEKKGLGTLLAEHFAGKVPPEFKIPNLRGEMPRAAKFR